jgi:uncharacterized protein YjiS (DUF1127 family)
MTISTYSGAEQRTGIGGRIRSWLAAADGNRRRAREFTSLESFNDYLLRDIGIRREPSHRRHLMPF